MYINLDSRPDRREQIESECTKMGIAVDRFPALQSVGPCQGCTLSHINVLQLARDRGYAAILVLEDDFEFLVSKEVVDDVLANLPDDYDVVMLSYNLLQSEPYNDRFVRVLEAQTASGYIVHSKFYERLLTTLNEGYAGFLANPETHWIYINDQYWKSLQPTSRWYASRIRIGKQRAGWSDLGGAFVDYGV